LTLVLGFGGHTVTIEKVRRYLKQECQADDDSGILRAVSRRRSIHVHILVSIESNLMIEISRLLHSLISLGKERMDGTKSSEIPRRAECARDV
jgi:hypothetical protein